MSSGNELCPICGRYNCAVQHVRFYPHAPPPVSAVWPSGNQSPAPAFGNEKSPQQVIDELRAELAGVKALLDQSSSFDLGDGFTISHRENQPWYIYKNGINPQPKPVPYKTAAEAIDALTVYRKATP